MGVAVNVIHCHLSVGEMPGTHVEECCSGNPNITGMHTIDTRDFPMSPGPSDVH